MKELDKDKKQALQTALNSIRKAYGSGSVMSLGEDGNTDEDGNSLIGDIEAISTGSIGLNRALGIGGMPRGRIVEIYGPESSGKTTLALCTIAQAQKEFGSGNTNKKYTGVAAFIDAEHAMDIQYAEKLGVNTKELLLSQPDNGEQALEIADILLRSNAVDIIVIDSVAALTPKAEIEGDMGDAHMGRQARLMSQALRKITGTIKNSNTLVIFINQIRMKIGVVFGNPETTTGGNALKFYASQRIDIRRIGAIKKEDKIIGSETRAKVVKNKVSPPFRQCVFDIIYGEGINNTGEVIDLATEMGLLSRSGTWYKYGDENLAQGKDKLKKYLEDPSNEKLLNELMDKIKG